MSFYNSKSDANLNNDIVGKEFDMYVASIDYQGNASVDNGTPATTEVTPSDTYDTANDVGKTLVIEGLTYEIASVDGTTWTIDTSIDAVTGDDASIEVVASRRYFGRTIGKAVGDNKEYKEYSYQGDLITKDIKKRSISIKGASKNFSFDLIKELFGLKDAGTRTEGSVTYYVATAGSNPTAKKRWQIELVGAKKGCKIVMFRFFNSELNADGEIKIDPEGYSEISFTADVFVDYPRRTNSLACGGVEDSDLYEYLEQQ